jgi:hypothetical protein
VAFSERRIDRGAAILGGELWRAKAAILLVSPAFLASDYIAIKEVPVLLRLMRNYGLKLLPIIISPCLYEETFFKYPNWKTGPYKLSLGALQSVNPPSHTLVEMNEAEQNRAFLAIARQLGRWLAAKKRQGGIWMSSARHEDRVRRFTRRVESASTSVTSKHAIAGGQCTACGLKVFDIVQFKWYRCGGRASSSGKA